MCLSENVVWRLVPVLQLFFVDELLLTGQQPYTGKPQKMPHSDQNESSVTDGRPVTRLDNRSTPTQCGVGIIYASRIRKYTFLVHKNIRSREF